MDVDHYLALIEDATDLASLKLVHQELFSKKSGKVTQAFKAMGSCAHEERKQLAQTLNVAKETLQSKYLAKEQALNELALAQRLSEEAIDITLPGKELRIGSQHPVSMARKTLCGLFKRFGFIQVDGPELETDEYNFQALNIPSHHPARAMHDTFYLDNGLLLRTHTSSVQIRTLEKAPSLPLSIIAPGRVFRKDYDATHTPMFHQIEGLVVDEKATFRELLGLLHMVLKSFFQQDIEIRTRPSYFPFTEPSCEIDIRLPGGKWLEVLGCGMVHPYIFENLDIDTKRYRGYAFGLGIERMAMIKYGITDLRKMYEQVMQYEENA